MRTSRLKKFTSNATFKTVKCVSAFQTMELVIAGSWDALGTWSVAPAEIRSTGLQPKGARPRFRPAPASQWPCPQMKKHLPAGQSAACDPDMSKYPPTTHIPEVASDSTIRASSLQFNIPDPDEMFSQQGAAL